MIVHLNGKLLPEGRAHISINDRGFLLGDGVYETLRVYRGRPFLLDDHLKRLSASLRVISLKPPASITAIGAAVRKTIQANRHDDAAVRITLTRGPGLQGLDPRPCKSPTLLITSRPYAGPDAKLARRGMTAAVVSVRRNSPRAVPPWIKATSCLNNVLAKIEANRKNADEGIFLTEEGTVAEGTASNIFLVKKDRVFTPSLDGTQLPGVARAFVCRLARKEGIRVVETKIGVRDLETADELFFTNSLIEVMPVTRLQSARPRALAIGPITRRLKDCYKTFTPA